MKAQCQRDNSVSMKKEATSESNVGVGVCVCVCVCVCYFSTQTHTHTHTHTHTSHVYDPGIITHSTCQPTYFPGRFVFKVSAQRRFRYKYTFKNSTDSSEANTTRSDNSKTRSSYVCLFFPASIWLT